jgi:hypothetical protein
MKTTVLSLFLGGAMLTIGSNALAGDLYFYPTKGQSAEQQAKDKAECYEWAKQQSGVDPSAPAAGPDRRGRAGGAVGGAARGAAGGAIIGAIAGDAGKGAAIGAAGGAMAGRRGAIQGERAAAAGQGDSFNRAVAACMEGRGYSAK